MKLKKTIILGIITAVITLFSCSKEETKVAESNNNQGLFFSFHTPDWERTIPCDNIDFLPTNEISEGVAYVLATSSSTNATFGFPFPADSSAMAKLSNLKKYNISDYSAFGSSEGAYFEISLKLNKTGVNDNERLYSVSGMSENNYNEITSVEYIGSETKYANFRVKGNYKMYMMNPLNTSEYKQVSGSYCIKFRTNKK